MISSDSKTTATSDILDLIQEEAITFQTTAANTNRRYANETDVYNDRWRSDHSRESSLFRVRLTQSPDNSKVRPDLEEEVHHHTKQYDVKYQKMPLHGGYGGMFEASGPLKKKPAENTRRNNNTNSGDDATHASDISNRSSISTAFRLASTWISGKFASKPKRNTAPSRVKRNNRSPSELFASLPEWCIQLSVRWLRLPFQFRYFVQLFSIVAVFLLASLNYFIEVDDGSPHLLEMSLLEGGGGTTNKIPSMHVKRPFQYLHPDKHGNKLLEKAKSKLNSSTRIGSDTSGPFLYGWKSMPRQIFLDKDGETVEESRMKEALDVKVFPPKGTVAYVLPVITCYSPDEDLQNLYPDTPNQPNDEDSFRDFAIMLRSMVHAHSYQNPASGGMYDYKMIALVHPSANVCTDEKGITANREEVLISLGYEVSVVRPQIKPDNMGGSESLRKYFTEEGGDDLDNLSDLIRLNAYELEEYNAVVLVDFDTLILGSVDEAIDLINDNSKSDTNSVNAVFSWKHVRSFDKSQYRASVVNLSFFILRPSKETYAKLRRAMKESAFTESKGWGKIGRGRFPGWMTTQGFLTFYYDEVDNAGKVEMNRCTFGNPGARTTSSAKDIDFSPIELITNAGKIDCETEQSRWDNQCQDCSKSDIQDVLVADMSFCIAPWKCGVGNKSSLPSSHALSSPLCRKFQKSWFGARLQMEDVHPQLQKSSSSICVGTEYQPMKFFEH